MANSIYQHFLSSEKAFIDQVFDWVRQVEGGSFFYSSNFLNPREQEIVESIANFSGLKYLKLPEKTDYAKTILADQYYQFDEEDFGLSLLEVKYPSKFGTLEHRQILGAFIHETGLARHEIGDILMSETRVQVYVSKHLVNYFKDSINKIGRLSVKLEEIPLSEAIECESVSEKSMILVNSMRLDLLLASALNISRNFASNMVQSGRIRINYTEILKKDYMLKIGDLISIRGFGRVRILNEFGLTKKDKMKVEIESEISQKGR